MCSSNGGARARTWQRSGAWWSTRWWQSRRTQRATLTCLHPLRSSSLLSSHLIRFFAGWVLLADSSLLFTIGPFVYHGHLDMDNCKCSVHILLTFFWSKGSNVPSRTVVISCSQNEAEDVDWQTPSSTPTCCHQCGCTSCVWLWAWVKRNVSESCVYNLAQVNLQGSVGTLCCWFSCKMSQV